MPKGLFLQNPVHMTDYCLFYPRSTGPLFGIRRRGEAIR